MICGLPFHRPEEIRFIIGPKSSRLSLEVTKRVGPSNEAAVKTEAPCHSMRGNDSYIQVRASVIVAKSKVPYRASSMLE